MSTITTTRRGDRDCDEGPAGEHRVELRLDDFAWVALERESAAMGVSREKLAAFAIAYYLADADSGRIARRLPDALVERR